MRVFLPCALALWLGAGCLEQGPMTVDRQETGDSDRVGTLFVTGADLGALKPCGCTGGQLGGLDRRRGLLEAVPANRRLVLGTGGFVPSDSAQDRIKLQILWQAYRIMGYDAVYMTEADQQVAQSAGLTWDEGGPSRITDTGPGFTKTLNLDGRPLRVFVRALVDRDATNLPSAAPDLLRIVIVDPVALDRGDAATWADLDADCVILPLEGDEPRLVSVPGTRPLVIAPGRRGRHVVRLTVKPQTSAPGWTLTYADRPVSEELPKDPELVTLYRTYQAIVAGEGLLERHAKVPLPDGEAYVGSARCALCHEEAHRSWQTQKHAQALATLETVGSARDPECVVCHVVGLDYDSGFVSAETTPGLRDVGCEVCHGPGDRHVRSGGVTAPGRTRWGCLSCHTPEHSGAFATQEQAYREKIRH